MRALFLAQDAMRCLLYCTCGVFTSLNTILSTHVKHPSTSFMITFDHIYHLSTPKKKLYPYFKTRTLLFIKNETEENYQYNPYDVIQFLSK